MDLAQQVIAAEDDPEDVISVNGPLFLRLLELAREDLKTDVQLHLLTENAVAGSKNGPLTMDDYQALLDRVVESVDAKSPSGVPQEDLLAAGRRAAVQAAKQRIESAKPSAEVLLRVLKPFVQGGDSKVIRTGDATYMVGFETIKTRDVAEFLQKQGFDGPYQKGEGTTFFSSEDYLVFMHDSLGTIKVVD